MHERTRLTTRDTAPGRDRRPADQIATRREPPDRIAELRGPGGPAPAGTRPDEPTPARDAPSPMQLQALQAFAGNRAVTSLVHHVQRVPMTAPNPTETLYNQKDKTTGQATAKSYGGGTRTYDMSRSGDTAVTVTVRIKFLNQARNSVDPKAPGAPPGTPELGTLLDRPTEIPANDPDNRRAWATDIASRAVDVWNGRLTLVETSGTPSAPAGAPRATPATPAPAGGTTSPAPPAPPIPAPSKRLPVSFASVPVFGLAERADATVIIHPMATVAGTPGQPIDSGNWYQNKGTSYGNDDAIIAAHEYGHLLGIPDEYSQNSAQLNALMHQAAPGSAASARPPLDRPSIERMVLHSLRQPLYNQLSTVLDPVTTAMAARKEQVRKALVSSARAGASDDSVTSKLRTMLEAHAEARVSPGIAQAVAFETTRNFSNVTIGTEAVDRSFDPARLNEIIRDAYWQALLGAEGAAVAVPGVGNVTIDVADSVGNMTASGGAQAGAASALATADVSGAGVGGTPAATPGLPAIPPPPNLASQLAALPATWDAAGSLLETSITPAAFASGMVEALASTEAAVAAATLVGRKPKDSASTGALYQRAYRITQLAARASATQLASGLVGKTVAPTLQSSVGQLVTAIDAAVDNVMGTSPSGIAALGTPNPNMTALVSAMKTKFDADKAAADTNPGRDPMGPSRTGAAPAQDVTYSYEGLMGSSSTRALREDQFEPLVANFNSRLRQPTEHAFEGKVR